MIEGFFRTHIKSTNRSDSHLSRHANPMYLMWIVLMVFLLGAISPMIAREPDEILGPESGYIDLRWRSDDKVVAIKYEYEFVEDKLHYDYGEIITVTYDIRVDTSSRGYMPNRTYYLLSSNVTGHQISGSEPYYWKIIKSDIDTLEVITDDRSLQGKFTLQMVHYRDKSKPIQMDDGGFTYFTPIDTTRVVSSKTSRPPAISFNAYRVTTKQEGANVYQHRSGKFYFDQQGGMGLTGKTLDERTKKIFKSGSYVPPDKKTLTYHHNQIFQRLPLGEYSYTR
ncbi:MAG: hypothetical protein PHR32_04395 [Candidatus Cloacimonetes bacterium]|nr:hypothetical protein [Candidatus Cloacimonadota bacterium]